MSIDSVQLSNLISLVAQERTAVIPTPAGSEARMDSKSEGGASSDRDTSGGRVAAEAVEISLKGLTKALNDTPAVAAHKVRFFYYEEADRVSIQVLDKESGEVIREFPPEEILKLAAQVQQQLREAQQEAQQEG